MTTLEIILICIIVWLVGMVICLIIDNSATGNSLAEIIICSLLWFIIVPFNPIISAIWKAKYCKNLKKERENK